MIKLEITKVGGCELAEPTFPYLARSRVNKELIFLVIGKRNTQQGERMRRRVVCLQPAGSKYGVGSIDSYTTEWLSPLSNTENISLSNKRD
jgi:hypothetical protein